MNYMLVNWVELKYDKVWSNDNLREKKWELKEQSFYFRTVKQGSVAVYLTFHVFMIFMILLMATVRRSIISFLYVIILLPRMKDGAEVLTQRDTNQGKQRQDLIDKLECLRDEHDKIKNDKQGKEEDLANEGRGAFTDKKTLSQLYALEAQIRET